MLISPRSRHLRKSNRACAVKGERSEFIGATEERRPLTARASEVARFSVGVGGEDVLGFPLVLPNGIRKARRLEDSPKGGMGGKVFHRASSRARGLEMIRR